MFAANTYVIRPARNADRPALRRLAFLDLAEPLTGRILVAEIERIPAAAISLDEGRTIADPGEREGVLRVMLHLRAAALDAQRREPSLWDRIRSALRREPITPSRRKEPK
jgi:hypothetical protein